MGRYTVLELVGRGGMGEVYAAYDPGLDRRVALKLMRADGAARGDDARERLLREGQAIAKLSHPNVVIVHDVRAFGDQVFVAMEFVEGVTLAAWLTQRTRGWREILAVFVQAARGLSAAHRASFVHRDFKPENVMVGRDGAVRVTDFGLARRIDDSADIQDGKEGAAPSDGHAGDSRLTGTGDRIGTPWYMAPEQFAGRAADARTDQFSFCVALHGALLGTHPFGGSSLAELVKNVSEGRMAAIPGKKDAPPWLRRILVRGLNVDPAARWSSMDDLILALGRDPARRRRRWVSAVVAATVLSAGGVLAAHVLGRDPALCLGGPSHLTGVWELGEARVGSRREAVRSAILKSGIPES